MKRLSLALCAIALLAGFPGGAPADTSAASEYGRVTLNSYSEAAGMAPAVFDHWLHRSLYTCRLCHVDIGFAMEAGGSNINAEANIGGYYCGTCHDGRMDFRGRKIFGSCADPTGAGVDKALCDRCHSDGKDVRPEHVFEEYVKGLPQVKYGNGVDWEKAEADGLIKPMDYVEGVSMKRPPLKVQEDFSIKAKGTWMSDVIFSHKKHAVWNGCEVCHPDIFPNVKKGSTKYTMFEIYDGQYCGVCHNKVAFPLIECQRCHINPVEEY